MWKDLFFCSWRWSNVFSFQLQLTWLTPPNDLEHFLRDVRVKCHVLEETVMQIRMAKKKINQICDAISTSWLISIDKKRIYDVGEFDLRQTEHRATMQAQLKTHFNNIKETISAAYQKCAGGSNDVRAKWEDFKKKAIISFCYFLWPIEILISSNFIFVSIYTHT